MSKRRFNLSDDLSDDGRPSKRSYQEPTPPSPLDDDEDVDTNSQNTTSTEVIDEELMYQELNQQPRNVERTLFPDEDEENGNEIGGKLKKHKKTKKSKKMGRKSNKKMGRKSNKKMGRKSNKKMGRKSRK